MVLHSVQAWSLLLTLTCNYNKKVTKIYYIPFALNAKGQICYQTLPVCIPQKPQNRPFTRKISFGA